MLFMERSWNLNKKSPVITRCPPLWKSRACLTPEGKVPLTP